MTMSFKNGFSFIEIMIAVVIMGVLAGVIAPAYFSYVARAKTRTTEANLRVTKQAITAFHGDTGRYPESLLDLNRKPLDDSIAKKWAGPYLELKDGDDVPLDGYGNDLIYQRSEPGAEKPYLLYSHGPEGEGSPEEEWIYA